MGRAWTGLLVPGCDHGGCGCRGDATLGRSAQINLVPRQHAHGAGRSWAARQLVPEFPEQVQIPRTPDVIADRGRTDSEKADSRKLGGVSTTAAKSGDAHRQTLRQ